MKDVLVGFRVAKLAKEKGFDEISNNVLAESTPELYLNNFKIKDVDKEYPVTNTTLSIFVNTSKEKFYSAPTQSLLQKWLREKYNIHISMDFYQIDSLRYDYTIWYKDFLNRSCFKEGSGETFELALEEALQEALKLIKID